MHARLVCECGGMWVMWDVGHVGCGRGRGVQGYNSVVLLSYSISTGALGSPYLLLSYSIIALLLAQHHHTNNNPHIFTSISSMP